MAECRRGSETSGRKVERIGGSYASIDEAGNFTRYVYGKTNGIALTKAL